METEIFLTARNEVVDVVIRRDERPNDDFFEIAIVIYENTGSIAQVKVLRGERVVQITEETVKVGIKTRGSHIHNWILDPRIGNV